MNVKVRIDYYGQQKLNKIKAKRDDATISRLFDCFLNLVTADPDLEKRLNKALDDEDTNIQIRRELARIKKESEQ